MKLISSSPYSKYIFGTLAILAVGVIVFFGVIRNSNAERDIHQPINPAFGQFISGYTAGVIGKNSNIVIELAQEVESSLVTEGPIPEKLFQFEPSISGEAFWIDNKTIEFRPEKSLESGAQYVLKFYLSKLMSVPDDLEIFEYVFQTIVQDFDVMFDGLGIYEEKDLKRQKLNGVLVTADEAKSNEVEEMLAATQNNKNLKVSWTHYPEQYKHEFIVEEVKRTEDPEKVKVEVKGESIGVDRSEELEYEVPALGDFKLMDVSVVHTPEQYVLMKFSDPIKENQNLNGLIRIAGVSSLQFIISQNELRVYPNVRQAGSKTVTVTREIRNILEYKLQKSYSESILFEQIKPNVRFTSKGNILPSSDGLVLPFEAVSLKAVEVSVYKVYANNVTQFLQVNNYDGTSQMRRVATPIVKKTIRLNSSGLTDLSKWNRFTLDLNELINKEPGAIYQVKLNFNKSHSAYFCEGESNTEDNMAEISGDENWNQPEEESSYWDYYDDYYYYDDYDWRERDNPCNSSYYYGSRRQVSKNILASDFGLLAKRGAKGELLVAVTDLKTAQPISGVNLEVFDYQKQLLATEASGLDGLVSIPLEKKPFLLVASKDNQKGYLKLDDGNSLSLSNFNVAGQVVQDGIKGFIYGERGVWRPGDSLHISFMLEDKQNLLPEGHPVVFEFLTPMGQLNTRLVRSESVNGIYYFGVKTSEDAPTGNWQGRVKVGGATFSKGLKVETIKPNRLKINLDFGVDKITKKDESIEGDLEVKWLHGAVAKNLRAVFDVKLTPIKTTFEKYPNHTFDDPTRRFNSETTQVFDGSVNDEGKAKINVNIATDVDPPGALNAYFSGRVYEEGGDFSVDRFSIPYYPYESFVGIRVPEGDSRGMLLTDTTHYVDVVTLDAAGNPISREGLTVELYKMEWRWWWDQSAGNANYISGRYNRPISKSKINTKNGRGRAELRDNYPHWGRYYIRVCDPVSNHCAGKIVYLDWPGWAGRGKRDIPGGATMLVMSTDKEKYDVGDKIKVTLPGSEKGQALVSIENGSGIIEKFWLPTKAGENEFEITATDKMTPNAYINISLLQPHNQTKNDLPIRMYGITGFKVEDPKTHLQPVLKMADVLEPGSNVNLNISEASGKPMAYTIAVVDEGILDLTRFRTPDPFSSFYAKEALGVKTWDLFDDVIGAYGGKIERLLSIGGDMEAKEEDSNAKRFKPVVKFLGPFYLDKGKTASHDFTMPQYVGSVRTMVVAANNGAYGQTEKATPVRQPLMVLATAPRVLGPGESLKLPVNVFAMEKGIGEVQVSLKTNNYFTIKGSNKKELYFSDEGDKMVAFEVDVKELTGIGRFEITVSGGGKKASQTIELDIRNPNPPQTNVLEALVESGKSYSQVLNTIGIPGTNSATIEVSNIPPINLEARMRYLIRYPHGCVEQTVSSVFPQLYLTDFVDLPDEAVKETEENIKAAIEKLKKFQRSDGSFSYWPGQSYYNEWGTSYAGHFLVEASNKGYSVPKSMIRDWVKFQKKQANAWKKSARYRNSDLGQSYRLYGLALAESPAKGAMNRMREEGGYSIAAGWRLAAAYALIGQPEAGKDIVKNLSYDIPAYREMSYSYGSDTRDRAMILEAMILLGDKDKAGKLLIDISKRLSNQNYWMSTQETSYSLLAVGKYLKVNELSASMNCTYSFNGKSENAKTVYPYFKKELAIKTGQNKLLVKNEGKGMIYVRISNTGTPVAGNEQPSAQNVSMNVKYFDSKNQVINPTSLNQGDDFFAQVTISNHSYNGEIKELALTQVFPSGWEIVNARMDETATADNGSSFTYQDFRDDRVMTYFDLGKGRSKTFTIKLIAAYAGRYYQPGITCEAMYDNSINARTKGEWVEVMSTITQ